MTRPNSSPSSPGGHQFKEKVDDMLERGYKEGAQSDLRTPPRSRILRWCSNYLKPECFTRSSGLAQRKVRNTAYLDGLRGFAAFVVYWHHHQLWPRQFGDLILENAYGFEKRYYFACLPGIRTFVTGGHFAVALFFVISGYVLSVKPLNLIYAGEREKLADNLGSALFKRWLRLYIPLIVTTFLYMCSWHAFGGIWTVSPDHQETFRKELWNWYTKLKNFSFVFATGAHTWFHYGFHLWSIPVEFQGSMVVFTTLLAFSRLRRNARLWFIVGLIIYFMYIVDGSFMALFLAGTLLCELDLLARNNNLPRWISRLEPYKTAIFYSFFIASIYLSGIPSHEMDLKTLALSPGWYYLSFLKPQAVMDYKWFFLWWAAVFLISATPRIWWLKAFFETRFNQYLGRISFSLYLIHGPLLWTIGDRVYVATGWYRDAHVDNIGNWINLFPLSQKGPLGLEPSFWLPHLILLPLNLWAAEVLTKCLDEPSVRFAQWLYRSSLEESSEK